MHYRFTAFGLSQLETKFEGGAGRERKDNQGFVSIGNFNRESSSQIFLLKQDITGLQYLAYLNGRLNLREAGFDRKIRTTRMGDYIQGEAQNLGQILGTYRLGLSIDHILLGWRPQVIKD